MRKINKKQELELVKKLTTIRNYFSKLNALHPSNKNKLYKEADQINFYAAIQECLVIVMNRIYK